jgi:hypothetical protein
VSTPPNITAGQATSDTPKTKSVVWKPAAGQDVYEVRLAEGSIRPMSQVALRDLAIKLKEVGAIDVLHLLQWLDVPDADEIAAAVLQEMKLAAAAKVRNS